MRRTPQLVVFAGLAAFGKVEGKWYWRLLSANGQIIADGSEGYDSKGNAKRAARRAQTLMAKAVMVEAEK